MPEARPSIDRTETAPSTTSSEDATPAPKRASAALCVVLEAERPGAGSFVVSVEGVRRVIIGRGAERGARRQGDLLHLSVPDQRLSRQHVQLERDGDRFGLTDLGSRNGTFVGASERAHRSVVGFDEPWRAGHSIFALLRDGGLVLERARVGGAWPWTTLSASFARELDRLERIAASALPLLLLGETGTGKELIAQAVHARSGRPGPFVAVNCGALPAALVESQLFGHKRGAFSGAVRDELGFIRSADRGTLFLDEIGDLPPSAQASLLRVLQEGEVTPVGAFHPIKVQLRVISATHQPLADRVAARSFRADLYARLQGFSFRVPPLRERKLDLGELTASLWRGAPSTRAIHPEAVLALLAYDYPMNVRELKQALDAAAVLADGGLVRLADLPASIAQRSRTQLAAPLYSEAEAALRDELTERLHATGYNLSQVAREMGKARQQVQRWIKRFGLKAPG